MDKAKPTLRAVSGQDSNSWLGADPVRAARALKDSGVLDSANKHMRFYRVKPHGLTIKKKKPR